MTVKFLLLKAQIFFLNPKCYNNYRDQALEQFPEKLIIGNGKHVLNIRVNTYVLRCRNGKIPFVRYCFHFSQKRKINLYP